MKERKEDHPRKTIGNRIHKTSEEREKKDTKKSSRTEVRNVERQSNLRGEPARKNFLTPKVENYVETGKVKGKKEKIERWIEAGYPVHIIGPTGCGKSTLAMRVAEELEQPMVWFNGDDSVTTSDLVGGYSQVERESVRDRFIHTVIKGKEKLEASWVDNPLTTACKNGYTFVYNDFSRSKPEANNVLLSVFQEGVLELPGKFGQERYIDVHPDFTAIMTSNSVDYAGVHRPQDALLDRMVGVYMDFYDSETEIEIVKKHTGVPEAKVEKIVTTIRELRKDLPEAEKPGTRACIMVGKGLSSAEKDSDELLKELYLDILATKVKGPEDLAEKSELVEKAMEKNGVS